MGLQLGIDETSGFGLIPSSVVHVCVATIYVSLGSNGRRSDLWQGATDE